MKWIACHDTLVCIGARSIQKWCVREGDAKGPLIAVMLTKDVAYLLAAAPEMLEALRGAKPIVQNFCDGNEQVYDLICDSIKRAAP
jgi:hypothetical protein